MHHPPSVSHVVQRSRTLLFIWVTVWLLACTATAGLWLSASSDTAKALCWTALVLVGVWAATEWFSTRQSRIQWDGQQWLWTGFGDIPVQQLSIALDFQTLILVQLRGDKNCVRWLWLEAHHGNRQWLAFRRALVATAGQP